MANIINIDKDKKELMVVLQKAVQSANLNFLIGSGCSFPAIEILGDIETKIQALIDSGETDEAEKEIHIFLKPFLESTNKLMNDSDENNHKETIDNYKYFLRTIAKILFERKSNILIKQATIFSTNYDLFIEKSSEQFSGSLILNDGFNRSPVIDNKFKFSTTEFFNSVYNNGNLYNYKVQIPSVNLLKLHGSLSWKSDSNNIIFSLDHLGDLQTETNNINETTDVSQIKEFNNKFSIILPKKEKLKYTILNQIYYDLLRIYANELDKENTLLIAEGFSFDDEHIFDITKRALRNPTLKLIVFCFENEDITGYESKFSTYNNVDIVYSESEKIGFKRFNEILSEVLPKRDETNNAEEIRDSVDE